MTKGEVKPKGKRGGKRPGAGMPKGKVTKKTLEKMKVMRKYEQKIMQHTDQIFREQKAMAFGSYEIFMVEHYKDEITGKVKKNHVHIVDPELIANILDDPDLKQGDNYVLVRTIQPDKFTLDSMLDRVFGKPKPSAEPEDGSKEQAEREERKVRALEKLVQSKEYDQSTQNNGSNTADSE